MHFNLLFYLFSSAYKLQWLFSHITFILWFLFCQQREYYEALSNQYQTTWYVSNCREEDEKGFHNILFIHKIWNVNVVKIWNIYITKSNIKIRLLIILIVYFLTQSNLISFWREQVICCCLFSNFVVALCSLYLVWCNRRRHQLLVKTVILYLFQKGKKKLIHDFIAEIWPLHT